MAFNRHSLPLEPRLFTCKNLSIDREARFFTYGIMADESTKGEKKVFLVCFAYWNNKKEEPMLTLATMTDINRCTGTEVANAVLKTCTDYKFDPMKCNYWLTDNAAYMSGLNAGAVASFNFDLKLRRIGFLAAYVRTFSTYRHN